MICYSYESNPGSAPETTNKRHGDTAFEMYLFYFYFTNGRYIECLSLTYVTDKSKA